MTVLELVSGSPDGLTLAQLATALSAPRSSIHYIVKGLVATGYLTENGTYTLGPAVGTLLAAQPLPVDRIARPALEALREHFDETVVLSVRIGESFVNVDVVESHQPIRFSPQTNLRRPLYPSAAGRCFLAHADPKFRDSYLDRHIDDAAERDMVRDELARVVTDGVAYSNTLASPGLAGIAVPIFSRSRHVAVLAVAGPNTRVDRVVPEIAAAAKAEAQRVSEILDRQ